MALSRKFLETLLGKEESDKIDEIIEKHAETVSALKAERDAAKGEAEKLPELKEQLEKLQKTLKDHEADPYKAQWEDLRKEFDDYKKGIEAEKTKTKKTDAYRQMLREAMVSEKRIDAILRLCPVDTLEFDEKGEVKDKQKTMDYIKSEWKDFILTDGKKGPNVSDPPKAQPESERGNSEAARVAQQFYAARGIKIGGGNDGGEKK